MSEDPDTEIVQEWLRQWQLRQQIYNAWRDWRIFQLVGVSSLAMFVAGIILALFNRDATFLWAWGAVYSTLSAMVGWRAWKSRALRKGKGRW